MMISDAFGVLALISGLLGLYLTWRQRVNQSRSASGLRAEIEKNHRECLHHAAQIRTDLENSERNAESNLELLKDGRLGASARARALQMLRSGISADTAAGELGLAKSEVRLLEKVGALLAPRT